MPKGKSLDDLPSGKQRDPKWEEKLDVFQLKPGEYHEGRLVGSVYPHAKHWVSLANNPEKSYPVQCPRFNPESGLCDLTDEKGKLVKCWCCDASIRIQKKCLFTILDVDAPATKKGKPPIKTLDGPYKLVDDIQALKQLNKHLNKKTQTKEPKSVMDPKYGVTIQFKHDPNADAQVRYSVQKGNPYPIDDAMQAYVEKNAPNYEELVLFPDQRKVKEDLIRNQYLDEDGKSTGKGEKKTGKYAKEDDKKSGKGGKKVEASEDSPSAKPRGKKLSVDIGGDEDEDEEDEDEDDSPAEKPSKKGDKGKPSKSDSKKPSKKSSAEEDEDEDEEDEEDEDEDDSPPAKPSKKSAKKSSAEEDEDEDEEDEEDEDEDDSPPAKPSKKSGKKK